MGAAELARAGETGIARAASDFMPRVPGIGTGAAVIAFGAVFSTLSALNAVVLASSRVAFAMGREEQLPSALGRLHHRFGTPLLAVLTSAAVMAAAVALVSIESVGNLSSLFFLLSFVVVNAAVIRLRRRRPDLNRPFEIPYYPLPALLGIVLNLTLGFFIDARVWAIGVGWLALGGVVYLILRERDGSEAGDGERDEARIGSAGRPP